MDNVLGVKGWAALPTQAWHKPERPDDMPAWFRDEEDQAVAVEEFLKSAPPRKAKGTK